MALGFCRREDSRMLTSLGAYLISAQKGDEVDIRTRKCRLRLID